MELDTDVQINQTITRYNRRLKKACQTSEICVIGKAGAELLESARSSGHGLLESKVQPT
jgi:hypothetical protein